MKELIVKLFGFKLMQYKFGRKFIKGTFYYIDSPLTCSQFWSEQEIKSCNSSTIRTEVW